MEEIKLAFETIVVGLLAIPWLILILHLLFYFSGRHLLRGIKIYLQEGEHSFALIGTFILGIAYCLGTIIFPIADHLFNDNHNIFGIVIKKDNDIKTDVLADLYFSEKYYQPCVNDFPGLPDFPSNEELEKALKPHAENLSAINRTDEEEKIWLLSNAETREKKLEHDELKRFHSIYNYQKYSVYNSDKGYDILKPLNSQIVVLRGAVLNGIFLFLALIILIFVSLGEVLWKLRRRILRKLPGKLLRRLPRRLLRKELYPYDPKKFATSLFTVIILTVSVWFFCVCGAWGVNEAEKEYDKHVVGLFYGNKDNGPCQKQPEGGHEPNTATQANDSPSRAPRAAAPKPRREKAP